MALLMTVLHDRLKKIWCREADMLWGCFGCCKNWLRNATTILLAFCVLLLVGCGTPGSDTAGILIETNTGDKVLIETNTGNKPLARILVSVENLGASIGDTLVVSRSSADTVGDTVYVFVLHYSRVFDSLDVASGIAMLDSLPEGMYDSVQVRSVAGTVRDVAVEWVASSDSLRFDAAMSAEFKGIVKIDLPDGFEDLAKANETFENMPFAVRLPDINDPCLLDADGNAILLDRSQVNVKSSTANLRDSSLYWGVIPRVQFDDDGNIVFDIVANCQERDSLGLTLARRVEHFDDFAPSEDALSMDWNFSSVFGNSRWTDSTDSWLYLDDYKPFSDDGYMGLSIWFNLDSMQMESYARIIAIKKDSTGFALQRRGSSGAVNLRLDTEGGGVYNSVFGRADGVLDGTWHNYAFKIHKDTVTTFIDGSLIGSTQFNLGNGFANAFNPGIGYPWLRGGIDELFFFDGTQSVNWMRLFYALQKRVIDGE